MTATSGSDVTESRLAFSGRDHVVKLAADGAPTHRRADFVCGPDGTTCWLRLGGRLYRRQP